MDLRTMANEKTANRWLAERSSSGYGVAEYCRYNEQRTQRSTSFDVIEIDDCLITEETEIADDVQMKLRQMIASAHQTHDFELTP